MKYKANPKLLDRAMDMYTVKCAILNEDEFRTWLIRAFFVFASVSSDEVLDFIAAY